MNPNACVPALVYKGRPILESQDIIENIEDKFDARLADGWAFLAGSDYSLADATWTAHLDRLDTLGVLEEFLAERPHVRNHWARLQARPRYAPACLAPRAEDAPRCKYAAR